MKFKFVALISLLASGLAPLNAQEVKLNLPGKPTQAAPAAFSELQLVEEFGWFIGKRVGLTELNLSATEIAALTKGLTTAASGKESPFELEKIGPAMDEFMQKKQAAYVTKLKTQNATANTTFFDKLKQNAKVIELPSGLRYEIVKPGDGPFPKSSQTVKVHYTGTLIDGTVFDSSVQRGEPAEFGLEGVIKGWTEGLQKINKGGKIKLYVPPDLGYGDEGRPGIPPASTLIFDVELLEIKSAAAAPAAPAK